MPENYSLKLEKTISLFHAGKIKSALEGFRSLQKTAEDVTAQINLYLWIASCNISLKKTNVAKRIIHKVLSKVELDEANQKRAQRLLADIHLEKFEFEPAMKIYLDLVKNETNLYELSYLQNLIDDASEKAEFYTIYGTITEWKAKLRAKIKKILTMVKR